MATPLIPDPYVPLSYRSFQEQLSEHLADYIDRKGLSAGEIAKRWPTCRLSHLARLRSDEEPLGMKMLLALAEATGLRVQLTVSS